ncbi:MULTISPECIES: NAD(P)/FAD-dependent oxidoreductase [Rhodococcus]|uniref:FAD-dependent oxidoreductase n=1 Tax=Rhodococcus qingshengii JCM 15477 TaxID=1303681 RepID=A0AB38RN68_RHOSG|nr:MULTISPECIES: FAD-dependent oxidoreductase [Rhodococcus]UPU46210.1 FAD-dependent oxidoreductase [Rhodococcus qingshengii JCM 15477]
MKIVVVGAGYAGTIAANHLAKKLPDAELTVVNPRADFVERVRLHQQIAGTGSAATPLTSMLAETIHTVLGSVNKIGDGSLTLEDGASLDFDYLLLAVGSTVRAPAGTVPVGTWEGAQQSRAALAELPGGSVVTVVGGGLTGIEVVSEVAEARPDLRVRIVGEKIGASLSPGAQDRVRAELTRMGVDIVEDRVVDIDTSGGGGSGTIALRSGDRVDSDLTLWAIVADVPDLAARSGLDVTAEGRAVVDEYLRSVTDPRVFVVGDCAAVPGARFACATATPQGAHAAKVIVRTIKGRRLKRFSMGYVGQSLSLGRNGGLLQMCRRDDTPRRMYLTGRIAATSKESIVRYAKYGSRTAHYAWMPGGQSPKLTA